MNPNSSRHWYHVLGIVLITTLIVIVGLNKKLNPSRLELTMQSHKMKGDLNSNKVLVEFIDYQCPFCKDADQVVRRFILERSDVKLVIKHYPLQKIHPNALQAAEAAECAADQGKFFDFHYLLFDKSDEWTEEKDPIHYFNQYAVSLGLDKTQFNQCLVSRIKIKPILFDAREGEVRGVSSTPSFIINGIKRINSDDPEELKKIFSKEFGNES